MMIKLRLAIVEVTASERIALESLAGGRKTAQALAMRARIVQGCASGMHNSSDNAVNQKSRACDPMQSDQNAL